MKLILTSRDFQNENSKKVIVENISKPIEDAKILFVPNEKASKRTLASDLFYQRLMRYGFKRENIRVFDYYNTEEYFGLTDLDILYIGGGNTFEMLKRIKSRGFDKEIIRLIESGVVYVGGSAGVHIVSQNIEHVAAFDELPKIMPDFEGLKLFDGIAICHYDETRKDVYEKLKAENRYKIYALTNDDAVVFEK